jgi:hypothetical protein
VERPVNIAPLVALRASGRTGVEELPREWFDALERFGIAENTLVDSVLHDPTLSSMILNPLSPEALATGLIGLVSDDEFPGGWDGMPGPPPLDGWWPEAIRLATGPPLAYPADPDPLPVLAFFIPVERSSPERPRTVDLARVEFGLPTGYPLAPPRITPTPDGRCGYQQDPEAQYRRVICATLNCPQSCSRRSWARDGGRSGVQCRCP